MADSKLMNMRAKKPLSLRDYLLEDLSSCSSNGFGSFPRRTQCCTTVRFLLEIELKHQNDSCFKKTQPKRPAKSALSTFQYAIAAAVKRLPFAAGRSAETQNRKKPMLARSISKKIIEKGTGFWKRKPKGGEIGRWKSFDELLKEDSKPLDRRYPESNKDGHESSGGDPRHAAVIPAGEDEVVEEALKDKKVSNGEEKGEPQSDAFAGSTNSSDGNGSVSNSSSTSNSEKTLWSNEEKEQSSPVSVLDCPLFDDEDDEVSSACVRCDLAPVEGTNKKLMKKIQWLEPVNLTKRLALASESDDESTERPQRSDNDMFFSDKEKDDSDRKALDLLRQFKRHFPSNDPKIETDQLMLDLFREKITNGSGRQRGSSYDEELFKEVEDWINGQNSHKSFLEWDVQMNRQSYLKDMEKEGTWKTLCQETMEVSSELETEVFRALLNEVLQVET